MVHGEKTNKVRSVAYDIELPQKPATASFFDQQAKHGTGAAIGPPRSRST